MSVKASEITGIYCVFRWLFRLTAKKTPKLRITGCEVSQPVTDGFPFESTGTGESVCKSWRIYSCEVQWLIYTLAKQILISFNAVNLISGHWYVIVTRGLPWNLIIHSYSISNDRLVKPPWNLHETFVITGDDVFPVVLPWRYLIEI